MWPYPWTHVGTPSHLGHMDRWPRQCLPKHMRERLKRHLTLGSGKTFFLQCQRRHPKLPKIPTYLPTVPKPEHGCSAMFGLKMYKHGFGVVPWAAIV